MPTYTGLFTQVMDAYETGLNTAYSTYNIFQGPRVLIAGFKFPAISIQWKRSIRDPGNRDGFNMFIDFIYIKNAPSDDLDDVYSDCEAIADSIQTITRSINISDIDVWGWLHEVIIGEWRSKEHGYLQYGRMQYKLWMGDE